MNNQKNKIVFCLKNYNFGVLSYFFLLLGLSLFKYFRIFNSIFFQIGCVYHVYH